MNKPFVKSLVLSGLTLYIGGVCSALGTWDFKGDRAIAIKLIMLVVGAGLYLAALGYYSIYEININKIASLYKVQNESFEELMSGIMSSCKYCADGANDIIHAIIENGEVDLKLWNFDKACQWVCSNVYDLLCKLGEGREFEVAYDRLIENGKPEELIYTNSYANQHILPPSVYMKKRNFTKDNYHDSELFRDGASDLEIVIGSDEIDKIFDHKSKAKRNKNKNKYSQYIAIPVLCNDKKMIGLFEIICLNKTKLGDTKEEIEEIISRYFIPYSFLLLLMHKLEKALLAQPAPKGKEDHKDEKEIQNKEFSEQK